MTSKWMGTWIITPTMPWNISERPLRLLFPPGRKKSCPIRNHGWIMKYAPLSKQDLQPINRGQQRNPKKSRYSLRAAINQAKKEYGQRVESKLITTNPRHLWQGLQSMTDYRGNAQQTPHTTPSFPDEFNREESASEFFSDSCNDFDENLWYNCNEQFSDNSSESEC